MTPFEEQLKQALQRQEPASDFTDRVLARCAEADHARRKRWWWSAPMWRISMASATAALFLATGVNLYQQHERQEKGLAAKRQLLLAMHIAGSKIQVVQQRLKESEQVTQ